MEILRNDFQRQIAKVEKAIEECDFLAIDTELTGLDPDPKTRRSGHSFESVSQRYEHFRAASSSFIIIQFGLCTFRWEKESGTYIAKPFNFFVFPSSNCGRTQLDRVFTVQAGSFDFLAKNHFDFNKWVYQGVPYMTPEDETVFREGLLQRLNDKLPDIPINEKNREFMVQMRQVIDRCFLSGENVDSWIADPSPDKDDSINITTIDGYQKRLVYQELRNRYKDLACDGRTGFIHIFKPTPEIRLKRFEEKKKKSDEDLKEAQGFRRVIDFISASKKPLVGHNMMLDICHTYAQFIKSPLPEDLVSFKRMVHEAFPLIFDTKYICAAVPELQATITRTRLDEAKFTCSVQPFTSPKIEMDVDHPRYFQDRNHEAGYDAYMTGFVFLRALAYVVAERKRADEPQPVQNPSESPSAPSPPVSEDDHQPFDPDDKDTAVEQEFPADQPSPAENPIDLDVLPNDERRMSWEGETKAVVAEEDGWGATEAVWDVNPAAKLPVESAAVIEEDRAEQEGEEAWSNSSIHASDEDQPEEILPPKQEQFPVPLLNEDGGINLDLLGSVVNKCNLGKAAVGYLDFAGDELIPSTRNIFHVSSLSPRTQSADVVHLFSSFGKAFVDWSDSTSCVVSFEKLDIEPEQVVEQVRHVLKEKGTETTKVQTLKKFLEEGRG